MHVYYLDITVIFSRHFHQFLTVLKRNQNLLHVELIKHETRSDLLFPSMQNFKIILYSGNVFLNHIAIYKNLNGFSQENLHMKLLYTDCTYKKTLGTPFLQ